MTGRGQLLPRSNPRSQGFDPSALDRFVKTVEAEQLGVHSVMVVRHGHVVAEEWWQPYSPDQPHLMFSVSKAFTATAIGLAVHEGRIGLDEPLLDIFPTYATPRIRSIMADVRIRHLLSMGSGQTVDTMSLMRQLPEHDWVEIFLSVAPEYPPGTYFLYNSGASHVLSAAVQSRTGQSVRDYLMPRLFEPLGIPKPEVESNQRGVNLGGSGFLLRTEDLATFGQLYLQRGNWNGTQLLPAAWVDEASTSAISTASHENPDWTVGYGFKFWRGRHNSYRADGAFGQFSVILPDQDAVVALTSGSTNTQGILDAVWDHLLPAMAAERGDSETVPTRRHEAASLPVPAATGGPDLSGRVIRFEDNPLGLVDLTLQDEPDALTARLHDQSGTEHVLRCGRNDWIHGSTRLGGYFGPDREVAVAGRVGSSDSESIGLQLQYVDTPFRRIITVRPSGEGTVEVTIDVEPPFWRGHSETLHGHIG
jgi:CubicO group peptidase (beta-lactamase class C family)